MQKKRSSQSGFFHLRFLLSFVLGLVGIFMVLIGLGMSSGSSALAQDPLNGKGKIAAEVLEDTANGRSASVVLFLADQADVSAAYAMKDQDARGWFVYNTLTQHAATTQASLKAFLTAKGISYQSFWVANMIVATLDRNMVETIAARADVARIDSNRPARWIEDPEIANFGVTPPDPNPPATVEWGVNNVNAPAVWAMGFTGQGMVIGNLDTGMRWSHNALRPKYRGWNGATADHNFNWHDAIHSGGGSCGANTLVPCDDFGHGTHTAGTTVGDDGSGNQVGVAPGAKWIGCRNMNVGDGTPATYTECFQFMIAPTDLAGNNANPTLRPHVINNSWGCPASEGCVTRAELEAIVNNTQAAGIFVGVSAGNSGPSCSSVSAPPAIYDASFSTGAIDISNVLASFSSRGPSTFYTPSLLKPNISAPGVNVRSTTRSSDSSYGGMSGTSMAGPHLVGVVALLWSARPQLVRDIDATKTILQNTANPGVTVSAQTCGGTPTTQIPNNSFGYGRVDALAAVNSVGSTTPTPSPTSTATATATGSATATATATPTATVIPSVTPCPDVSTLPLLFENFDGVTPPALPAGWSTSGSPPVLWVTSTTAPDSPPNDAFVDDPATVGDKLLETPNITIPSFAQIAGVSFRNFYDLEKTFDGGVLEVSSPNINGGAFTDITSPAVGGYFTTGGYNATISTAFMSPIAGRMAWSGNSGGYINSGAALGPHVVGTTIRLRFRMASDNSVSATGWRVDNVLVSAFSCQTPSPTASPTATATATGTATIGETPTPTPSVTPTPTCVPPLTEGFDDITTLTGADWVQINHSSSIGITSWFQGNSSAFVAQSGAANSYIGANFNNTTGTNTISNWLLTPPLQLQNGMTMTFFTRTVDGSPFPDRLQVRMSSNGASSNVGTTATEVGDFVALLLDINPTYGGAYPEMWTAFTVTITGVPSETTGRLAFRYFVENGGPTGGNSNYIGIDSFQFNGICPPPPQSPTPTPATTPTPGPAYPLNLSTRLRVRAEDGVGIGGFIITGTDPRRILLRGIGPSLGSFGVPDPLPDPEMELHGPAGFTTISNDNWRDTQEAEILATGLPPSSDLESAILITLNPGSYTAIVKDKNNTPGVGLVEFYDVDFGHAADSKLANISTRGIVETGTNVMIAGFILGGNSGDDTVILRGIGPSLSNFGVPDALSNPVLELHDHNGALHVSNDNWQDDPAQAAIISAAGLALSDPAESGIAATLPAGQYTAILAGVNMGVGTGLVEAYDLGGGSPAPSPTPVETPTPAPSGTPVPEPH